MSPSDRTVQVTLELPRGVYERAAQAADQEKQRVEDLLSSLIAEGLEAHTGLRELWEQLATRYRARLGQEGRLDQSADDVLQELRELRERTARELYP